ncbi:MAG: SusD/RagB family nutrient-binding outer membrane lipoprotein [Chitinophagaceae bacterium]|nr:SusD/RagB family nutrient-binding outer membrane lipoprotein [Chitinophagaceae bacterium]
MKKIINRFIYTVSAGSVLLLSSCSKKIDEAFANPNAQIKQPIETLLPGVIANMAIQHSANGTLYGPQNDGLYIGRFVQNWATNTTGNQYDQMGDNFINSSDIMGSIWAMHYYGMGQNINRIIEWGTEEKKWDYVGVAQAIRAWAWLTLTDIHDDVILYEAFRPDLLVFKYNTQAEVYEEIKRLCKASLDNLSKTGDGVSQANLAIGDAYMNGGDVNKWKKFVYGVMARTYNRTTNKAEYKADSVVYYCDLAMQTNTDNTSLKWSNAGGVGTYSYWSPFRGNIGTLRQTKFVADLMQGVNSQFPTGSPDPRAWYIIRENTNGTFKGTRPNKGTDGLATADQPANFWGGAFSSTTAPSSDANCRYIFRNAPIFPIITASEIQFIKAEALLRSGNNAGALAAYRKGIELNFAQLRADYEATVPTANKITDGTRDAFLANPVVVPAAANLTRSHIMMQKYVAMYGWGVVETWVDIRRYHYTDLDPVTGQQVYREFAPPTGTDLYSRNNGKWIYRHRPRFNSEYLYNIDELNRLGAFATDYITKEQWFSKP